MNATNWAALLGRSGWDYVCQDMDPELVARVLTQASELGFRPPGPGAPAVAPDGTRVEWPGHAPALTAAGLARWWRSRGHTWLLFRIDLMLAAARGPGMAALQALWTAYEDEARRAGLAPQDLIPGLWRGFVGGTQDDPEALAAALAASAVSPTVETE